MSKEKNSSLIVGLGEVGQSIYNVLSQKYNVHRCDVEPIDELDEVYDILHICIPFFDNFVEVVKDYQKKYQPRIIVIHSTIPVGTSSQCGDNVVHSPIRGKHPDLTESLTIFPKEIGTNNFEIGVEIEKYFNDAGIKCKFLQQTSEATELAKIMSTTYYAWNIIFAKEMKKLCDNYKVDYDFAYKKWNEDYNLSYDEMDEADISIFHRPVLKDYPGKIGGHCLIPNCDLDQNVITDFIKKQNEGY